MNEKIFNCSKCGYCCRTLWEHQEGILLGLALLTQEEKELFNPKDIVPKWSIGKKHPTEILCYQMKLAVCPHLNEKNECLVYQKRPLVCRSFPMTYTIEKSSADIKCPQISKYSEKELYQLWFSDEIDKAMIRITVLVRNLLKKQKNGLNFWNFDIASNKWIIEN